MSALSVKVAASSPNAEVSPGAVRGDVYAYLSQAYSFPDASLHAQVTDGPLVEHLSAALSRLPYRLKLSDLDWRAPVTSEEMQTEFIRLFQIGGRKGPPCTLHSGFYGRDRGRTLQHLIRFYNYFGFSLGECVMPDHLCVQLDFMSLLARGDFSDSGSLLRAQRDFLRSQLAWTEQLATQVRACKPVPFYRSLATVTARVANVDLAYTQKLSTAGVGYACN